VYSVNYEIVLNKEQAAKGIEKELIRKGKKLKVAIPAGVMMGSKIRLRDALNTTDKKPGDIIISIKII
jgi:DnaJ-class molecular chaperone